MSSPIQNFIPLRALIDSLPGGKVSPQGGDGILDKIGISDFDIEEMPGLQRLNLGLAFANELGFEFPGVDGLGIYFGSNGATNQLSVQADIADDLSSFETRIVDAGVILRFPPSIFRSVQWTGSSYEVVEDANGEPQPYEILLGGLTLTLDSDGDLTLSSGNAPPTIALSPLMIGETGIVIESDSIEFYLSKKVQAPGQPAGWRGLHIQNAKLYLPGNLADTVGILQVSDAYIGSGGFSGRVSSTWPQRPPPRGARAIPPWGGPPPPGAGGAGPGGNPKKSNHPPPPWRGAGGGETGKGGNGGRNGGGGRAGGPAHPKRPKTNVLDLELDSLKFEVDGGVLTATMSGKLIPKVPGLTWPTIDLKDLKIDSKGNVQLPGGWLDLPKQCGLDFHGFKVAITKFGMGRNEDGTKWFGFSGSVKLVDGLPAGGSVEGLRITVKPDWSGLPRISFNGVGVELDAKAFYFKGAVSYREFDKVPQRRNGSPLRRRHKAQAAFSRADDRRQPGDRLGGCRCGQEDTGL